MAEPTKGFAVMEEGDIDVRTVSPTRRAAMVNFLIVSRGVAVRESHSDEDIEDLWGKYAGRSEVIGVDISANGDT